MQLREIIAYLDETLEIGKFRDYAPNGLQVEGAAEVERVVTGVSANAELVERAIELGAKLIVVEATPESSEWEAIADRLKRAAT